MVTKADTKPRRTLSEIRKMRAINGKKGAMKRAENARINNGLVALEKKVIRETIEQRAMRATDRLMNSQISLATGQQFLFRIDKEWIPTKGENGYFRNKPPVLVTSQHEIETYLEELAENNGDLSDNNDGGAAYYYITTKEPNNQAIDSLFNRVHGKPTDGAGNLAAAAFSLLAFATRSAQLPPINGNKDVQSAPEPATLPHPRPSSEE